MTFHLTPGAISSDTLNPQDLAYAMVSVIAEIEQSDRSDELDHDLADDIREIAAGAFEDDGQVADMIDHLDEFCPPMFYCGMHEGDGACLGVWFHDDELERARQEGDVHVISDPSDLDNLSGDKPAVFINDHGNVTYYEPVTAWRVVWSIV